MDCKITKIYLKEKARLCRDECVKCPFSSYNNGKGFTCYQLEKFYPEEAIAIVQKWSDEHQPKTYADDFFEKFPNAPKEADGAPKCCRENIYSIAEQVFCNGSRIECYKCWNEVMTE